MAGDARARRHGGFETAAGQMTVRPEPLEDASDGADAGEADFFEPVRLARQGGRAGPCLGGAPPGVLLSPDVWDPWRKGAIDGIMGAGQFYRQSIGSVGGGDDQEGCREEREKARDECAEAYANG